MEKEDYLNLGSMGIGDEVKSFGLNSGQEVFVAGDHRVLPEPDSTETYLLDTGAGLVVDEKHVVVPKEHDPAIVGPEYADAMIIARREGLERLRRIVAKNK